jgi:DNA-binding NarL/FixJ family response regulator
MVRLDAPSKKTTQKHPDGLSAREVDVLRLIAAGNSNQQIADALFISPSTVAHHVTSILTKTDSANRAEAATYASRNGLVGSHPHPNLPPSRADWGR